MKIVLAGSVLFSRACLEKLISLGADIVGVVSRPYEVKQADYVPLDNLCERHGIPFHVSADINSADSLSWLRQRSPDYLFCFGWSQILRQAALGIARRGTLGYHPAALPKNRGRHPIIWALALGLPSTASTFFLMSEYVDAGDIVSQVPVDILQSDDASSLYRKLTDTALEQITEFLPKLIAGTLRVQPQHGAESTSWRRRTPADGRIDWRMPSAGIHNLVRALARPYPGATVLRGDIDRPVWRTRISTVPAPPNLEPGRVLAIRNGEVMVKTGDGAVELVEHELDPMPREGDCL